MLDSHRRGALAAFVILGALVILACFAIFLGGPLAKWSRWSGW
jgi:hypothetical protein